MILIISIILIIGIICFIVHHYEVKLKKENNKISFKESIDLVQLPIVTLYSKGEKFNFLLDTGSTDSHISSSASHRLEGKKEGFKMSLAGYGKESDITGIAITTSLEYKDKEYEAKLHVNDTLDSAFEGVRSEYGVQLHGILGGDFFQRHKYVLDFAELVAYSK